MKWLIIGIGRIWNYLTEGVLYEDTPQELRFTHLTSEMQSHHTTWFLTTIILVVVFGGAFLSLAGWLIYQLILRFG